MAMDFKTLRLSPKPNQFLMLPAGFRAAADPHAASPVFAVDPAQLADKLRQVALAEPRTRLLSADETGRRLEFVQRSAVFRFPDYVSVEILPAEGGSTLAVYSRAKVGYSDLGVNRRRIERWIAKLEAELGAPG
jgi:uncharacterized protein (DUF1499 family)